MGQPDNNLQTEEGIAQGLPPVQVHSSEDDQDVGCLGGVKFRGGAMTSPNPPISKTPPPPKPKLEEVRKSKEASSHLFPQDANAIFEQKGVKISKNPSSKSLHNNTNAILEEIPELTKKTTPTMKIEQEEQHLTNQKKKIVALKPPKANDNPKIKRERKTRTKIVHNNSETKITMFTKKQETSNTQEKVQSDKNIKSTQIVLATESKVQREHTDMQGISTKVNTQHVQITQADLPVSGLNCNISKVSLSNNNPSGTILDQTTTNLKNI